MTAKVVYARDVAEAMHKHLQATVPSFYWAVAQGTQWPYAADVRWPEQPSLDYHLRHTGEGVLVRVFHNTHQDPLAGEALLCIKFTIGLAHCGHCIEAVAAFLNNLDVSTL